MELRKTFTDFVSSCIGYLKRENKVSTNFNTDIDTVTNHLLAYNNLFITCFNYPPFDFLENEVMDHTEKFANSLKSFDTTAFNAKKEVQNGQLPSAEEIAKAFNSFLLGLWL